MHASMPMNRSLVVTALAQPGRPRGVPRWSWTRAQAVLTLGAAALLSLWALPPSDDADSHLGQDVTAFQRAVAPGTGTTSPAAAAQVLSRRYLAALPPELRLSLSEQVRAEQEAGFTPAGNDAFVMRRLALYEEALQRSGMARAGADDAR